MTTAPRPRNFPIELLALLVPTFQVSGNASGKNSWMIGPEGFTEIKMQDFH